MPYNAVDCFDYTSSVTEELMGTEHWRTDTNRRKPKYSVLRAPQIPRGLAWDQTWASKKRGQDLPIQATAWQQHLSQSPNQSRHSTTSWEIQRHRQKTERQTDWETNVSTHFQLPLRNTHKAHQHKTYFLIFRSTIWQTSKTTRIFTYQSA